MLNELEQKIRKAIPELNELGVGCVLEIKTNKQKFVFLHRINNEIVSCSFENEYNYNIRVSDCEIIGKPIQLNHVLEYLIEEFDITRDNLLQIIGLWDLKHNLLSEQSPLLIKFINEL